MKRQPTVLQITWFLDMHRTKQLDISPPYQRKSVWSTKDRRFFLDTIFRNYPCPPIFLHKTIRDDGFTEYHVVDGKQRLETIFLFVDNQISLAKDYGDETYNGKIFNDLSIDQKRIFWDYSFTIEFIDILTNEDVKNVFDRVNRNAKNLKPQELRHARFSGWFISDIEEESEAEFWETMRITTKARIKRMYNIQFISELMLIIIDQNIVGFSQDYLDKKTAILDDIEEVESEVDVDEYKSRRKEIKQFIISMEKHNGCIKKYMNQANFYTLWALISLYKNDLLKEPKELAEKYNDFLSKVKKIKENDVNMDNEWDQELKYAENARGASTDYPQRKSRLESLENRLLK